MEPKPTTHQRWPLWEAIRNFLWRHRIKLAGLYLLGVGSMAAFLWYYPRKMPGGLDLGLTVALRSWLHQGTFDEVETASEALQRGDYADAETRLEGFLEEHGHAQAGQMYTHAVTEAHELLSEVYARQDKPGRAVKTLEKALSRTPLHWRLWEALGIRHEEQGDLERAAAAYREAFKLTLDHPRVAKAYLGVLAELARHSEVLWVNDHFQRASLHAAPTVEVKAGSPRSSLQQMGLDLAGIEVEHGEYSRVLRRHGLERGRDCELSLPGELFAGLAVDPAEIYLQLEFHNVYHELTIESLRCLTSDGATEQIDLEEGSVRSLRREDSGSDYHIELRLRLPASEVESIVVVYSCPDHALSGGARALVRNARRNLTARETR